jgi:hypothetical protein
MDSPVVMEARSIFNLATWDGSIMGWMERDIDQYPKPGTVAYSLCKYNPAFDPERYFLPREQGQELLAASRRALEIFKSKPQLVKFFIDPYTRFLHDEHETISRIHLRAVERLVLDGEIDVPYDAIALAGFAYLFRWHGIEGVMEEAGISPKDLE